MSHYDLGMIKRRLEAMIGAVIAEASNNPDFEKRLIAALEVSPAPRPTRAGRDRPAGASTTRRTRRSRAVVDPIERISHGESALRDALRPLDLEQLKDIVAEQGMDTRKLAMKWKDPERLIDLIVRFAGERVAKGTVFRPGSSPSTEPDA